MIKSDFLRCARINLHKKRRSQVWGAYDPSTEKTAQKIAKNFKKKIDKDVLIISAATGFGIKELLEKRKSH